ncbi:hypothetical protein Tco_0323177 [Tanacetum coccineum]
MNEDYYEQNSCYDPNSFGFDQYQPPQFPVNYPPQETSKEILQAQEDLMEAIQAFLKEYDHIPPNEKCMALLLAEERFLKIKQTMEEEQNQPEVMQELLLKLMDDLQILKGSQQEKKETAAQSFIPYWNFSMIDDEEARDNFLKDICTFLRKFSRIPFGVTPKVILIAWERFGEIKDALTDKQYRQEDIQELMSKLLEDVRNIREELSEYINCPSWNRPTFYDNDDDEYTIIYSKPKAMTPDLLIEEPDSSLSMGKFLRCLMDQYHWVLRVMITTRKMTIILHPFPSSNHFMLIILIREIRPLMWWKTSLLMCLTFWPPHPTLHMDFDFIPSHNDLGSDLDISSPSGDRNNIYDLGICIEVESTRLLATHSPVIDTLLPSSSENKDKVFNHGVLASKEKSPPSSSHQGFKASKLFHQKNPMLIHGEDIPILDVPFLYFYPP